MVFTGLRKSVAGSSKNYRNIYGKDFVTAL